MNKASLEWVMSRLNQYSLTTAEVLFLKTVSADFGKNQALTEPQEERLENLYKENSRLIPNKKLIIFPLTKVLPKRPGLGCLAGKCFDVKRWGIQRKPAISIAPY